MPAYRCTYTHNGTQWEDAANAGTAVTAITVAAGDTVEINDTTAGTITKYFTEAAEEEPAEDAKKPIDEITVEEAYELARKALEKANQVGVTNKTGAVKFGSADGGDGTEVTADDFNVGDKKTIGGTEYTVGDTADNVKTAITAAITKAVGDDTSTPANTAGAAAALIGSVSDGTNTIYILKDYNGGVVYNSTNSATNPAANTAPTGDKLATDVDAMIAAGATVTFTADTTGNLDDTYNASGSVADDDTDGSTIVSAAKMADLVNNPPADGTEDAGTPSNVFEITTGSAKVAEKLSFNLHVGSDADLNNKIAVDIETMNSAYLGVKGLNVTDKDGMAATYAIDAIADAIAKVSEQRSALGAVQNRLEHTIANLDNVVENTTAAESRIRDTDMAEEMVEYSKNNILAQAGQSMLAQANQSTQGVLSLLG